MWLRACPRCGGDLVSESDGYGRFVSCIQCGCVLSESQEGALIALCSVGPTARIPVSAPRNADQSGRRAA
jgi:hypothetical protein